MKLATLLIFAGVGASGGASHVSPECSVAVDSSLACKSYSVGVTLLPNSHVICLRGEIESETASAFEAAIAWVSRNKSGVRPLTVVQSSGGFLSPALDIAEYISAAGGDVVVDGICASACAQFLFVAAKMKYITSGGIVAFHGGPISDEVIAGMDVSTENKAALLDENQRFRGFYTSHGVDMSMLTNPPLKVRAELKEGKHVFWTWSEVELRDYGVNDVVSCNPT